MYVPQRLKLNSLSAYHWGHGGGAATCFISLPEYPTPANAAEAITPDPNRHNSNLFIISPSPSVKFLYPASFGAFTSITTFTPPLDVAILSRSFPDCKLFLPRLPASRLEFHARVRVCDNKLLVVKSGIAARHEATRITTLQLHQVFFIFLFQSLQNIGVQN